MKHYIYKTTNLINGKIYIGKHSSQNIETDNYLGSGKILKKAIKKYGRQNFKKQVLHVFSIEEQAYLKQKDIVDQQFLSRKDTYNITLGGRGSWFFKRGMSAARLVQTGQIIYVSINDSRWKTGQIEGVTHNMATARLVQTGQIIQVTVDDSKWKTGQLEGCLKGTIFITNGKQERMIKKEIPIPQGWEKGRKLCTSIQGGQTHSTYGTIFINNGTKQRMIKKEIPIPQGWEKGKIPGCQDGQKNPIYGKIWITNGKYNKMIKKDSKIPQGWRKGTDAKGSIIYITNGKSVKKIKKNDPIPDGWRKGRIMPSGFQDGQKNPIYGKIWITNGSQNRAINRNALIPQGWKRGKTQKLSVNKQIFNLNTIK